MSFRLVLGPDCSRSNETLQRCSLLCPDSYVGSHSAVPCEAVFVHNARDVDVVLGGGSELDYDVIMTVLSYRDDFRESVN